MYDDEVRAPFSISDAAKYYKVARFPTRNIKTPIVMIYGGSDSLVDIKVMLKELPRHAVVKEVPHYEHLDFLWASDVNEQVFPHVFSALEEFAGIGHHVDLTGSPYTMRRTSPKMRPISKFSDIMSLSEDESELNATLKKHSENISSAEEQVVRAGFRSRMPILRTNSPKATISHATERTSTSRPEGWWSSDEVVGTEPSTPATTAKSPDAAALHHLTNEESSTPNEIDGKRIKRADSRTSVTSFGEKGISLGVARPVVSCLSQAFATKSPTGSNNLESQRSKKKKRKE